MLIYWFAIQLLSGLGSMTSFSQTQSVAWFAHVGGFLAAFCWCASSQPAIAASAINPHPCTIPTNRLKTSGRSTPSPSPRIPTMWNRPAAARSFAWRNKAIVAAFSISPPATWVAAERPNLRIAESQAAAQHLLLAWRQNLRWPDARLENTITARMTLAGVIRRIRPRTVILPYWTGRHPDHYRAAEIGYEVCFLAGLRRLEEDVPPHRPFKVLYSSIYANVTPSFVVDISRQFDRRMAALFSYQSQYGDSASRIRPFSVAEGSGRAHRLHRALLWKPNRREIRRAVCCQRMYAG